MKHLTNNATPKHLRSPSFVTQMSLEILMKTFLKRKKGNLVPSIHYGVVSILMALLSKVASL